MSGVSLARMLELKKLTAKIFSYAIPVTETPNSRNGSRLLHKKPSSIKIGSYYPSDELYNAAKFKNFRKLFADMPFQPLDFDEIERNTVIHGLKRRGKGAPKKSKEKKEKAKKRK